MSKNEEIRELKKDCGYLIWREEGNLTIWRPPEFTVAERLRAIEEYLGVTIKREPETIKAQSKEEKP